MGHSYGVPEGIEKPSFVTSCPLSISRHNRRDQQSGLRLINEG